MPKPLNSALAKAKGYVTGFTAAQRTIAIIGIAAVLLGAVALGTWLTKPSYVPLFTGLSASDASTVVEQLDSGSVDYQLTDGGATILVPEKNVYQERLKAAADGLPSASTSGYALLDTMGVTSSEFQQSVTYKRALEGELGTTIAAMEGVSAASVKLAIPEETVFTSKKEDPTASVFVETKNGVTLSTDQVTAIVHLTSASIEGMKPADVAVIDSKGTVLSSVGAVAGNSASEVKTDYEAQTEAAVQSMLDKILGKGKSTVAVAAKVSTESTERLAETYEAPKGDPSSSEQTDKESYTGGGGGNAGVLGPDNIAVPDGANSDSSYSSEKTTKDNALNKVTESTTIPAGSIARQTVSVAVDTSDSDLTIRKIEQLVSAAVGAEEDRGDIVTVEAVTFSDSDAQAAQLALDDEKKARDAENMFGLVRTGIIALGILIPIVIAIILFLRRGKTRREEIELDDEPSIVDILSTPTPEPEPESPVVDTIPGAEPSEPEIKRAEVKNLAKRDPARTATLLRGMMDERTGR